MKINFTIFNNGQEHVVFDSEKLESGEKLIKFIVSKDDNGRIDILPMVQNGCSYYSKDFLINE